MAKNGIAYTTKDKYDYPFWKTLLWTIIPWFFVEMSLLLFLRYEVSLIAGVFWAIFIGWEIAESQLMKKSYLEIHSEYIRGYSLGGLVKKSVAFTVRYRDITDIYTMDGILTVCTAYEKYRVQAYKCEKEVEEKILERMSHRKR